MARLLDLQDTIAALSSPPGRSARAIVRVSGPQAFALLCQTCPELAPSLAGQARFPRCVDAQVWLPRWSSPIPVMALLAAAPRTYTGQDLVEFHLPGSPPLVEALLNRLFELGARQARAGEFTLRAFMAGKIDLPRAEAILGVIEANDPETLQSALAQLAGGVGRPLHDLRNTLLDLLAQVEAGLDFAEEDLTFIDRSELVRRLAEARNALAELASRLEVRNIPGRPFRVVLVGPPNAGKSSLFNALLGSPAALVSPEAGATRDWIAQRICLQGVEIELIDTAGVNLTASDPLERQAQQRRADALALADLVIDCLPCTDPAFPANTPTPGQTPGLSVWTKADLVPETASPRVAHLTSATTGQGIEELRQALVQQVRNKPAPRSATPHCRQQLLTALTHLDACLALADADTPELLALELRLALEAVGELVGEVHTDDLLDRIFSQFCIGK